MRVGIEGTGASPGRTDPGHRARRRSLLLLFVGLPLAWLFSGVWSVLVGTGDPDGAPRIDGPLAAWYELPSYLVLVAVAGLAVYEAARARRARAPGSGWVLAAGAFGLFGVLAMVGTVAADNAVVPHSPALNAAVVAGAAVVAVVTYVVARRSSTPPGAPGAVSPAPDSATSAS